MSGITDVWDIPICDQCSSKFSEHYNASRREIKIFRFPNSDYSMRPPESDFELLEVKTEPIITIDSGIPLTVSKFGNLDDHSFSHWFTDSLIHWVMHSCIHSFSSWSPLFNPFSPLNISASTGGSRKCWCDSENYKSTRKWIMLIKSPVPIHSLRSRLSSLTLLPFPALVL
jgi:hypothetical protein